MTKVQSSPVSGPAIEAAIDLTEKTVLAEYYSGRLNGDRRIREGFKSLRAALAKSDHAQSLDLQETRWAVNVLLEKIAEKFEGWETMDLWRSEAAATVRSFKHQSPDTSTDRTFDEMVHAGAVGICQDVADHDGGPSFQEMSEQSRHEALTVSRACLTAALAISPTDRNRK